MAQSIKRVMFALTILLVAYIVGIILYSHVEGWRYLDAAYFLTATFATIGYGDIVPVTDLGKMLTIVYGWIGIAVGFYFIYELIHLENEFFSNGNKKKDVNPISAQLPGNNRKP
jgi:voltage-gated potassium channel